MMKSGRAALLRGVVAVLFVTALVTYGLHNGIGYVDTMQDFHQAPLRFLESMQHAWDPKLYYGIDTGSEQLQMFPGALAYGFMAWLGLHSSVAQHVYYFSQVALIAASMAWFVSLLRRHESSIQPIVSLAAIFYGANLYVAAQLQSASGMLWPYVALPIMTGVVLLAARHRQPLRYGALFGLSTLVMTGVNPALSAIDFVVVTLWALYLTITDEHPFTVLWALVRFALVGGFLSILLNAYWLFPFANYAQHAYLSGIFSESIILHSAAAHISDVLRLLGDPGFFGADDDGVPYQPFSIAYHGTSIFNVLSHTVPILVFASLLFARVRQARFAIFFPLLVVAVVPLAAGAHMGPDGTSWFAHTYLYMYDHYTWFDIFRGVSKWNSALAFASSIAMSYAVAGLAERFSGGRAILRTGAIGGVIVTVTTSFLPVSYYGWFRPLQRLNGFPAYWNGAAETLQIPSESRTLGLPQTYLRNYFWGEVGTDFANLALDRPLISATANGAGLPSKEVVFYTKAVFNGMMSRAPWEPALLRHLGAGTILEQGDTSYAVSEPEKAPVVQRLAIRDIEGAHEERTSGALSAYSLGKPFPTVVLASPIFTALDDAALLSYFALGSGAEVPVSARIGKNEDARLISETRMLVDDSDVDALALLTAKTQGQGTLSRTAAVISLVHSINARVYVNVGGTRRLGEPLALIIDGQALPFNAERGWTLAGSLRMTGGKHRISSAETSDDRPWTFRIVRDDDFVVQRRQLQSSSMRSYLYTASSRIHTVTIPRAETYRIATVPVESEQARANYDAPVQTSTRVHAADGCLSLPVFGAENSISESALKFPASWYFDPSVTSLVAGGRISAAWYPADTSFYYLNPFTQLSSATLRADFAAIGDDRKILVNGMPAGELRLSPELHVSGLRDEDLAQPQLLPYTGKPQSVRIPLVASRGWSKVDVAMSAGNGFPPPLKLVASARDFLAFADIGVPSVTICGSVSLPDASFGLSAHRRGTGIVLDNTSPDATGFAGFRVAAPKVGLTGVPILRLSLDSNDGIEVEATVRYRSPSGRVTSAIIPLASEGGGVLAASLVPRDDRIASSHDVIDSIIIWIRKTSTRSTILQNSTLSVRVADVQRTVGSAPFIDTLTHTAHVDAPPSRDPALSSLVLAEEAPATFSDVDNDLHTADGAAIGLMQTLTEVRYRRVSDQQGEADIQLPFMATPSQRQPWRHRIRLFSGGKEYRASNNDRLLPDEFAIGENALRLEFPLNQVPSGPWTLVYVPDEWIVQGGGGVDPRSRQITIPYRNSVVDRFGRVSSLQGGVVLSETTSSGEPATDHLIVETPVVETLRHDEPLQHDAIVRIDGRRIVLRRGHYGPTSSAFVSLSVGTHAITVPPHNELLLEPASQPKQLTPVSVGRKDPTHIEVRLAPAPTRQVLLLNEMYADGWEATSDGGRLLHYRANGFANGWLVEPGTTRVTISYRPETLLQGSRLLSLIALAASFGSLFIRRRGCM